jgi:putative heme-binding domain-containing protein
MVAVSARAAAQAPPAAKLAVRSGDHISLIGNTLADRMQHDGWLETYFQSRFPKEKLVFRNLGFSADELTVRLRSQGFGSPDEWLGRTKTDIVFAFFGYNESYAGTAGLGKFKKDLDDFLKHTRSQKYNGKDAARLVLFSPIAQEPPRDRNLPDPAQTNQRLEAYTAAMREVARANGVPFVDLYHPSKELYARSVEPLTINGIHLTERGNEGLAKEIDKALFLAAPEPKRETERLEKIRQAVLDRNFYWFNRYRTVDGFNVYGGRSHERYTDGITNRVVMQREMEVLDVMTANRDKRVWAVAQGGDLKVDDSNVPLFIPVKTNLPGPLPGGKHVFQSGAEEIKKMTVGRGLKVDLFASEKEFPELVNPVQMEFDTQGRLWVAVWPSYPHWKPGEPMNDKLIILEDTKGTGKADKMTVFADHLHCPTGFTFYNGGVLVAQAPDLIFLKDTDGDGKADVRRRVLHGLDSADTHHTANSFVYDPGGALYFQEGTFHHTQVETPYGPPQRCVNAGVFRYEPRTQKFEVYVAFNFANPHGHVFDRWGQDIVIDGTGANPYHAALFSGQVDYPHRHSHPPQVYKPKTRPCPGAEILSSRHFPPENQGNLLVANVISFRGILQYRLEDRGASIIGKEVEPILSSTDPNFRPADLRIGPDGALYFTDWHNPIIGHLQHHIRDPNRDREHGRVYRVTCEGRPLLKSPAIAGAPVGKLLNLLKEPEDRVRYRARIELGGRDSAQVIAALEKWTAALDRKDPAYEHHLLEALWLHQSHNVVNEDLLRRMLRSPDFRARAAATRVLCYWRDRVRSPLELLRTQINDDSPRVRLEAIRALSFFHGEAPLGVAVELLTHPDDEYLRFVFNETLNTLERRVGSGTKLNRNNIASSLVQMLQKGTVPAERQLVLIETICRHGGRDELGFIWAQVKHDKGYPAEVRRRVLHWLAEAAITRRVQPAVEVGDVRALLAEGARNATLLPAALRLATAWQVKETAGDLRQLARNSKIGLEARAAAIDGMAVFADPESQKALRELTAAPTPMPVRFRAAIALAQLDLKAAAGAAATALASARETDDPGPLVEAFLNRKKGSAELAAALESRKVPADAAKRILRAMYLAGRNDAPLADVVGRLAGLDAAPKPPTPDEVRRLAAEVLAKGDPARGERVFRRADLGCIKCHAINRAGGTVGPDLGPIGGTSPLDYIITSILDPNASIKEEYLTKLVVTKSGQVITGIVVERGKNQLVLKEATGKLTRIPTADVEEETAGKSLMPEGITRILTKGELLDLLRFVGELGKPGPFAAHTTATVQRWKRLRDMPALLREGIPNREAVRDTLLRAGPEAWETAYSLVEGTLPLDELKAGRGEPIYLQAEVNVAQAGAVEIQLDASGPVTFWVDEEPFESQKATVQLSPGRHRVTVRVVAGQTPRLRVELRRPNDSRAHFDVVQSE